MESASNLKSLLFLPPEIRLLIYRYLLISKERYITIGERFHVNPKDVNHVVFFDPIQKRKIKGVIEGIIDQYKWMISTFAARHLPCPALPLFLCNSTISQEAAGVFFAENTFRFYVRDGEADWDMLYGWLKMIGRHNICRIKRLEIVYMSVDVRIHEGSHKISAKRCYDLDGVTRGLVPAFYDTHLYETMPDWFEVVSASIEQVFRKLSWSDSPLTVTMWLPDCRDKLVPRLLYPEVDLQEYDPLPLFNPFRTRETSSLEWEYDQAGARYSPKEFCMVPDLIEGYRKKYGKNTLTVQWEGRQYADEWDRTKRLLLRSGWEILRWEEKRPAPGKKPKVSFIEIGKRFDAWMCLI